MSAVSLDYGRGVQAIDTVASSESCGDTWASLPDEAVHQIADIIRRNLPEE